MNKYEYKRERENEGVVAEIRAIKTRERGRGIRHKE
jgi:hypothetical protein